MRSVGIKALKNRLSEYVRAAAAGEIVLVTDRDRVVAELVPPRGREDMSVDAILDRGVREGWYTPPETPHTEPLPIDEPASNGETTVTWDQLMVDIAADREDR
ncbi:type II toxin-antitoxin system Phd/YefM family antitoxin [uncultured Enterovirga sp.]|uniref:type II toxin-antitoxin system Phd/YefM family antitoxin n=1 Tax=uncultured Enterovirga sp. TaxID=2026352 RepID=UPI0035C9892D